MSTTKELPSYNQVMKSSGNHYSALNVDETCSVDVIKKRYKDLALKYHPDRIASGEENQKKAQDAFRIITDAYVVLMDPTKRRVLDERLKEDRAAVDKLALVRQPEARRTNGTSHRRGSQGDKYFDDYPEYEYSRRKPSAASSCRPRRQSFMGGLRGSGPQDNDGFPETPFPGMADDMLADVFEKMRMPSDFGNSQNRNPSDHSQLGPMGSMNRAWDKQAFRRTAESGGVMEGQRNRQYMNLNNGNGSFVMQSESFCVSMTSGGGNAPTPVPSEFENGFPRHSSRTGDNHRRATNPQRNVRSTLPDPMDSFGSPEQMAPSFRDSPRVAFEDDRRHPAIEGRGSGLPMMRPNGSSSHAHNGRRRNSMTPFNVPPSPYTTSNALSRR